MTCNAHYRRLSVFLFLAAALMGIDGCGSNEVKKDSVTADSSKAQLAAASAPQTNGHKGDEQGNSPVHKEPPAQADIQGTPSAPPALPDEITNMKHKDIQAYINNLVFSADAADMGVAKLSCVKQGGKSCVDTERGEVFIQPEWGVHLVDFTDVANFPDNGIIVGRIYNSGRYKITNRGILGKTRVYWVVDREALDGQDYLRSRYIELKGNSASKAAVPVDAAFFVDCGHPEQQNTRPAKARWQRCEDGAVSVLGTNVPADTLKKGPHIVPDTTGWLTCSNGCCIAGARFEVKVHPPKRAKQQS